MTQHQDEQSEGAVFNDTETALLADHHGGLLAALERADIDIVRMKKMLQSSTAEQLEGLLVEATGLVDRRATILADLASVEAALIARRRRELEAARDRWVEAIGKEQAGGHLPADDEV